MAGTFEIVFSGLCLFLFDGNPPRSVEVNLVRTSGGVTTECPEAESATYHVLHPHQPYLVIPTSGSSGNSMFDCSVKVSGMCSPTHMGCENRDINGKNFWVCDIENRELCVEVDSEGHELKPKLATLAKKTYPDPNEEKDLYWLASLKDISDKTISRLKPKVTAPVLIEGYPNELIVSRVRSHVGELSTKDVGQYNCENPPCDYHIWSIAPPSSPSNHPKALTEQVSLSLSLGENEKVRLTDCQQPESYWWSFQPGSSEISVGIENLSVAPCKSSTANECIVGHGAHPNRLRHFLWYYQLVDWHGSSCPDYLPAPVCNEPKCQKKASSFPRRGDANHFCPPTTYP